DGDEAGIGTGEGEDGGADQPVVDHHVGGGEAPERPDREQLGVAGAGADQRHGAGGAGGGCRKAAHDPPPRAARPGTIADRTAVQPACSLPRRAPCLAATPPHAPGARSFVRKNIVPEYPPMPFIDRFPCSARACDALPRGATVGSTINVLYYERNGLNRERRGRHGGARGAGRGRRASSRRRSARRSSACARPTTCRWATCRSSPGWPSRSSRRSSATRPIRRSAPCGG